jgi:uracil-DNA glycosylase
MERCIRLQPPSAAYWRIMLLGEAPGAEEEQAGEPFVGRAGRLLDSLLQRARLPRASCVVTNVFHIRPRDNDVMLFFCSDERLADPTLRPYPYKGRFLRAQYGEEIERLRLELTAWKPKVVIALGATALWAMCGRTDISAAFGTPIPVQSHIVLPVFHPAFLLRQHNALYEERVVGVLKSAIDYANAGTVGKPSDEEEDEEATDESE